MQRLKKKLLKMLQDRINLKNRKRLIQREHRTIIASNRIGGFLSHYLGLQFQSPTVNLFIKPDDYLKMLQNFDDYFHSDVKIEEVDSNLPYPVGKINDCTIFFMQYHSFDEAAQKWKERCSRIDKNALYILMTDRDGCTEEQIRLFDVLPYKDKVIFTHKEYPEIESTFYIKGFENEESVGQLQETMSISGKRYIDQFDYVSFFNQG